MTTRFSTLIIAIAIIVANFASATASTFRNSQLSASDDAALDRAIELVDDGDATSAIPAFETLVAANPESYLVNYEYAYALCQAGRCEQAAQLAARLCESPAATDLTFRLLGKALSKAGRADEALAAYREGLAQFPLSAELSLEIGDLLHLQELDSEALASFNAGISADPAMPANYYAAAKLYLCSENTVWGLVYAETQVLINPLSRSSHYEMMRLMARSLNDRVETGLTSHIETPAAEAAASTARSLVDFTGIYAACENIGIRSLGIDKDQYVGSIEQLAKIRRATVETYFNTAGALYGEAMQLLSYQKRIIDAGHWDAYNNFLFSPVRRDEAAKWNAEHQAEMRSFIDWFNANPMVLDYAHTTGADDIYRDFTPMTASEVAQLRNEITAYGAAIAPAAHFAKN